MIKLSQFPANKTYIPAVPARGRKICPRLRFHRIQSWNSVPAGTRTSQAGQTLLEQTSGGNLFQSELIRKFYTYIPFFCLIASLSLDVTLKICGSVHAGFALKQSNPNVRIIVPKSTNRALVTTDIEKILSSTGKK